MTGNEGGIDENGLLEGEVVLWRNSEWRVTTLGLEEAPSRKSSGYHIRRQDLHWDMWPSHMAEKHWVDHSLFMEGLRKARELHPRKEAA